MKKRIQKCLSGSNEGFSLVELIIVIAIMAILVGVVALAVIPYLEKSRESKDLQALDTIASALTTAVADVKATGSDEFSINASGVIGSGTNSKVAQNMASTLGDSTLTLGSNGGAGQPIMCYYNTSTNKVVVYVGVSDQPEDGSGNAMTGPSAYPSGSEVQLCRYNDNAPLMVSN
ncbi:MAG: type II secretion system GspH family protein [Roseburia sp.]|nr:type II secretion system GspH family protein [Roseburia sp.]